MRTAAQFGTLLLAIASATITEAQTAPASQPTTVPHHARAAAKPSPVIAPQPTPQPAAPQVLQSLLDKPASPAQVDIGGGKLSVNAQNSSLTAILHDISSKTGMTIDGLSKDQRIFGIYGPGNPREVLSSLLIGVGYNVLMVGDLASGAPRQLLLSPRAASPANGGHGSSQPAPQQQNDVSDDTNDDTPDNNSQPDNAPVELSSPPQQQQQNQQQPGQNNVRTPQQMLQELQQMRQQQMQQQQQPPQP